MSERTFTKLAALALTTVVFVVALSGGYATYAAFADTETVDVSLSTGNIGAGNTAVVTGQDAPVNAPCTTDAGTNDGGLNAPTGPCGNQTNVVEPTVEAVATPEQRR